jgi:hypothetical protein
MPVVLRDDWFEPRAGGLDGAPCFVCDAPVTSAVSAVVWYGDTMTLLLHSRCAGRLGAALLGDEREADLARGRSAHWSSRVARAVRSAIRFDEGTTS